MDNRKRLPTPATVAPVPGTLLLDDRGSGGLVCAKARQGAQPRGSGRAPRGERLRRGPEAGGLFFIWPPWGPDIGILCACAADAYRR